MDSTAEPEKPIYLTYLNGTGFCFNVDDYMKIRTEFKVVGSLVGTCNIRGWTPDVNGLPAEFNGYETQLLIEKGFAHLVSKDSLNHAPNNEERKNYQELLEKRINEQETLLKTEKLRESEKNIEKILAGKRKKMLKSGIKQQDINLTPAIVLNEIAENLSFDKQNALLDIPCEHPFDHEGTIVKLPRDKSLKYQVFLDLWERGMFVTSGEAFGADFIAYPGDPMMFHASHIVIVMNGTEISKTDLITKGRLAVTVNKICIFAYSVNDESMHESEESDCRPKIRYQTLHWEGCKDNAKKT